MDQPTVPVMTGRYTNYFEIRFTTDEFLLDFGEHYPEAMPPQRHTRIVTTVESAQALVDLLEKALVRHRQETASRL